MKTNLQITEMDYSRLHTLIKNLMADKKEEVQYLETLAHEIQIAEKVDSRAISPEYVTMNTKLEIVDMDTGRAMQIKLVYPGEADFRQGKVSVLSPLGSALIGYKEGDVVSFNVPRGVKEVRIGKILFQPEAMGEYDL